jgi:hypothetical protein
VTAVKHDFGKPRLDLVPPGPLLALGDVMAHGEAKYGNNDWRSLKDGDGRYYAAALRHMLAWRTGERDDPESGLPHLAHVLANVVFLFEIDAGAGPPPPRRG